MSENKEKQEDAFMLRLNGKILPWALVLFFIAVIARALLAEYRIHDLETDVRDHENRVRVMEGIPRAPDQRQQ